MRTVGVFIAGIAFAVVAALVAFYVMLREAVIPANADARPGPVERFVARTALRADLRANAPMAPNPVPLTDENLDKGIRLYGDYCAACHGTATSDKTRPPIAEGEYPSPPQLATRGVEDDPEGWTFWKIKHGIRWTGMPSWKDVLNDQDIWTLALFLKHMDKLPPEPQATWRSLGENANALGAHLLGNAGPAQKSPVQ